MQRRGFAPTAHPKTTETVVDERDMDSIGSDYFSNLGSLLSFAGSIVAAFVAAALYWRGRQPPVASGARAPSPGQIVYRDAPTVRVMDAQRVDRRRKLVKLSPGEFVDIVETSARLPPRFRIVLKRVVDCEGGAVAHIGVQFAGAAVSCGPLVEEIGFNEFVLPRASRDDPRNCVYHYQESGDALDFMRIKLRATDPAANWAEIDVLQVSGHWPSG